MFACVSGANSAGGDEKGRDGSEDRSVTIRQEYAAPRVTWGVGPLLGGGDTHRTFAPCMLSVGVGWVGSGGVGWDGRVWQGRVSCVSHPRVGRGPRFKGVCTTVFVHAVRFVNANRSAQTGLDKKMEPLP